MRIPFPLSPAQEFIGELCSGTIFAIFDPPSRKIGIILTVSDYPRSVKKSKYELISLSRESRHSSCKGAFGITFIKDCTVYLTVAVIHSFLMLRIWRRTFLSLTIHDQPLLIFLVSSQNIYLTGTSVSSAINCWPRSC